MLIQVNPHKIVLIKTNDVNSGEYNVNECTFEFSQEFDNLTCIAVFSLCDGTTRNITILNNRCIIPTDVLQQTGQVKIGVYGYSVQDDELVLRYSPTPQIFVVTEGSYKEGTEPVAPSPTDWEILVEQVSDNSRDISNIQEDINNINTDIENIGTEIDDLDDKKANINDLASVAFSGSYTDLINKPYLIVYATKTDLSNEETARENADINLQNQIDAISVSSDVVDVVGTYQELVDYDTQHLKNNDIVKVLDDSTHNDALSYYRWDKETSTWSYVGSEGPFYTKGETDTLLNGKVDNSTLDDYVQFTDIPTTTKSGPIKDAGLSLGYSITQTGANAGKLEARIFTYGSYQNSLYTNGFIGKGTLENVITGKNLETANNKITTIDENSTDTQYPSAKCVYESQTAQDNEIDTLKMIYNILPTDTDTGETISIDNTGEMPIKDILLGGNTSQTTTSISGGDDYDSPSPEHPQNIEVVTGENDITIEGKNLFDKDNANVLNAYFDTGTVIVNNPNNRTIYIKCEPNTAYTFQRVAPSWDGVAIGYTTVLPAENVQVYSVVKFAINSSSKSITTGNDAKYLVFRCYNSLNDSSYTFTDIENSIQIEQGSTATTYQAYQGATYPINLGNIELCKISTYQDRIYKSNDKWYLEKQIGKVVLNGSENWGKYGSSGTINQLTTNFSELPKYYGSLLPSADTLMCNYFKSVIYSGYWDINNSVLFSLSNKLSIQVEQTVADFKTWLSTHNTIVYYVLATPTTTEITDNTLINQLDNLQKAISYDSQTNISQTNEDKPFIITAEMFLSLKDVLN